MPRNVKREETKMTSTARNNTIIAILTALLLVMMFVPSIAYEGQTISPMSYVWLPYEHVEFEAYLTAQIPDFFINDVATGPALMLLLGVVTIVLCLMFKNSVGSVIAPAFVGLYGITSFASNMMLKMSSHYALYMVLLAAILVFTAANIVLFIRGEREAEIMYKQAKEKQKEEDGISNAVHQN